MIGRISYFILRLMGWRTSGSLPSGIKKAILIVAPHTSNWDFIIGRLTFWVSGGGNLKILIKKEAFVFPVGFLMRKIGALPVDRGKKNNLVDQVVDLFKNNNEMVVVITPEGTRQLVRKWKKGFYLIAVEAKVPIALGYIDYGKKTGGVGPILYPTGDYEKDMEFITNFYKDMSARHPENFSLSPQNIRQ